MNININFKCVCQLNWNPFLQCCLPACPTARQTAAWLSRGAGEEAALGLNLRGARAGEVIWANTVAWCSSQWMPTTGPHELHFNSARTQPHTLGSNPTALVCASDTVSHSHRPKPSFHLLMAFGRNIHNTFYCKRNVKQEILNILMP